MAGLLDMLSQESGLLGGQQPQRQQPTGLLETMMFDPRYRDWYRAFNRRFGGPPDLNDPQYNYGAAVAAGVTPQPYAPDNGFPHWSSEAPPVPPRVEGQMLKSGDHPTRWMETFMQRYGVDPNYATSDMLLDAARRGIIPMGMR